MVFEWDPQKAQENLQKHQLDFRVAIGVFFNPHFTREIVRADMTERRWLAIGAIDGDVVVCLVYTIREGAIRLISARHASRQERRLFHEQFAP